MSAEDTLSKRLFLLGCCLFLGGAALGGGSLTLGGSVLLRSCVGLLVESEDILVRYAVLKVDDRSGIDRNTHVAGLEVEVSAGAAACITAEGDRIAGLNYLIGFNEAKRSS